MYKRLLSRIYRRAKPKVMFTLPVSLTRANSSLYFPHLKASNGYQGFQSNTNGQASREIAGFEYLNPDSPLDTSFLEIDSDITAEEDYSEEELPEC